MVNRVYYKSATDDGIVIADVYEPFPFVALALILTAVSFVFMVEARCALTFLPSPPVHQIQCGIDEWDTGVHCNVTFSEENYSSIYETHLKELKKFERESGDDKILTEICTALSRRGR